ncbi:MAG: guanylate kinase [OCS116 cluster bacterium]|uniref:Guanylate kinase n=1 Tax=OCS116 cluster bacterium TaxID=2030921 RepID=A0A2A4YPN0_9PROT|nr:guanylate kinase [OCS116 cluster bacterium]
MEKSEIKNRGVMLVISSPSGAGKSTLTKLLMHDDDNITLSISATTRQARPGEVEGKDYFFLNHDEFRAKIDNDEMLEWASVFGNLYGTPKEPVYKALDEGKDVLFDIDWQGTQQLHAKAQKDLVRVFILPPTASALEQRLHARAQDSLDVINSRMKGASRELEHWAEYDYIVINDDLKISEQKLKAILYAEKQKRNRQQGLVEFVRDMQGELRLKFED